MTIFQITGEVAPFSRTGVVAETIGALSRALAESGLDVTVFSPAYLGIEQKDGVRPTGLKTWVNAGGQSFEFDIHETEHEGVTHLFMANPDLFGRRGIYGAGEFDYSDNDIRFGTFCQACLNYIKHHGLAPDILHCHGWQTALVPVYRHFSFPDITAKTVLTIHDLTSQGTFEKFCMEPLNLPWDAYTIEGLEFYDNVNFTKGGIVHADAVTAVSPRAAAELTGNALGFGLEGVITAHEEKVVGIPSGVDDNVWNPEADPFLSASYSGKDPKGKQVCKNDLAEELGLDPQKPFIGVVVRFSSTKGMELILENPDGIRGTDAEFIVHGYNDPGYTSRFRQCAETVENVTFVTGYDEAFVHRLYAGIDIMLTPSVYEPCGISQLIGQRYGAIPVVHGTGGLWDAVHPVVDRGCGFIFDEFDFSAMKRCIDSAISRCRDTLEHRKCIEVLMGRDVSWRRAVQAYIDLYTRLREET